MQIYIQNNENKIKIIFPINILRVQITIFIILIVYITKYLLSIKTKFANNFLTNDKQACNY
jgi:hypothetical protein